MIDVASKGVTSGRKKAQMTSSHLRFTTSNSRSTMCTSSREVMRCKPRAVAVDRKTMLPTSKGRCGGYPTEGSEKVEYQSGGSRLRLLNGPYVRV